ncbi:MAG: hypothetical protein HY372_01625 [Candidatus Andersenbacteria bacterium]|nr:hypothetical protein [Candidatus Andersenbacteria bacterium]
MTERRAVLVGALGLAAVMVLGMVAGEIGGVAIRSASRTHAVRAMGVSTNALVPGVPVRLTVDGTPSRGAVLLLRWPTATVSVQRVGAQEMQLGIITARVPCEMQSAGEWASVRLLLADVEKGTILAQSRQIRLLAPGPDCLF